MNEATIEIVLSRDKHVPALAENGGKTIDNTGKATIVANSEGRKLRPLCYKTDKTFSFEGHALFQLEKDYIVIQASHEQLDFTIKILQIKSINKNDLTATANVLATYQNYEWDDFNVAKKYTAAIEAALNKANCINCNTVHYFFESYPNVKNNNRIRKQII